MQVNPVVLVIWDLLVHLEKRESPVQLDLLERLVMQVLREIEDWMGRLEKGDHSDKRVLLERRGQGEPEAFLDPREKLDPLDHWVALGNVDPAELMVPMEPREK